MEEATGVESNLTISCAMVNVGIFRITYHHQTYGLVNNAEMMKSNEFYSLFN
jgi:hypothetical protein